MAAEDYIDEYDCEGWFEPEPPSDSYVCSKCPHCGSELVKRTNKKNGQQFYGCSKFPCCKFTCKTSQYYDTTVNNYTTNIIMSLCPFCKSIPTITYYGYNPYAKIYYFELGCHNKDCFIAPKTEFELVKKGSIIDKNDHAVISNLSDFIGCWNKCGNNKSNVVISNVNGEGKKLLSDFLMKFDTEVKKYNNGHYDTFSNEFREKMSWKSYYG